MTNLRKMKKISVVSSAFNEEGNVEELYLRVKKQFDALGGRYEYEQIVLDNASTDSTLQRLKEIAAKDKKFKVIANARNFGHIRSPYYGILQCHGNAVIYLASDLQDPPELIPAFIDEWEKGNKVVLGQKQHSKESPLFFFIRKCYYMVLSKINDSGTQLLSNCTGFGLYDRIVVEKFREINDPYPYVRGLVCELGYQLSCVPFIQPSRKRGFTKNNLYTLYDNAMIGIINHSKVPLRMAVFLGGIVAFMSAFIAFVYFLMKLFMWDSFSAGTAPLVLGVFFIGAVQLLFLGILGEYIGAILTQVLKRPLVIEKERINFNNDE